MENTQNGRCLIVRMIRRPRPSLPMLDGAVKVLRRLGFDVQIAKISDQIVLAALGNGQGRLSQIREDVSGIESLEYGLLSALGYEHFKEVYYFMAQEEQERSRAVG